MAWPPVELLHLGPENNETKKAINAKIKFFLLEMHMMLFSIFETLALAQRSEDCRGHHHWLWHKGPRTAEAITIVLTISCFSQYAHPAPCHLQAAEEEAAALHSHRHPVPTPARASNYLSDCNATKLVKSAWAAPRCLPSRACTKPRREATDLEDNEASRLDAES